MVQVKGNCPMGCGETLFLGSGGFVTCSYADCPNPTAMSDIMEGREIEHIVKVDRRGFSIKHPLRERLDGELFECGLHEYLRGLPGPPAEIGYYRVRVGKSAPYEFEAIA